MGSEWTETTLSEIASDISYGYTESAKDTPVGPHFLRITDIQNGTVNWRTVPYCTITQEDFQKYKLERGDIVVARTGNSTGENYLFNSDQNAVYASYLIRFKIASEKADPRFVWYSMRSPKWWSFIDGSKTGSAQAGANAKVLGRFPLYLPPLAEQQVIANILGSLDDKIELNRKINETLEQIAQAIFKSWFIDFDPVVYNAVQAGNPVPERFEATAARYRENPDTQPLPDELLKLFPDSFDDSELGPIPKGWGASTVGEGFDITMGQSPPGASYNKEGEGFPFFQGRRDFDFRYPAYRVYCTEPKRFGSAGDTLISVRAPVGDINMAKENCCIGRGVAAIRHKAGGRSFTYYSMRALADDFASYEGEGTVFGSINKKQMKGLPYIEPPDNLVRVFEDYTGPMDENIETLSDENCTLAAVRDTLLPKLISGKLRIPDAESLAAEATA